MKRKVSAKHTQWLKKELPILEGEGVLSPETSGRLKTYYDENTASGMNWAVAAFSILGSLLMGLGIILLFAHNWDGLARPTRAVLSFCPLLIGAALSLLAVVKNGGTALRESAGLFHSLAVGAAIALIGQTYHLPSDTPAFLLTWALLIMPLMFLLRSTGSYLIYLALACGWSGVAQDTYGQAAEFWLLMVPPIIRLVYLIRKDRHAPDTLLSLWGILFALCISTGIVFEKTVPGLWIVAYSALLSGAGLLGMHLYGDREGWGNPLKTFGIIGMAMLAYLFTWAEMWDEIGWSYARSGWRHRPWGVWMDGGITFVFLAGWAVAAVKAFRRNSIETVTLAVFPISGIFCFLAGSTASNTDLLNALIFNGFMLFLGIMYIVLGCRNTKLRQLNGGMAVLSLLLVTRFFDADLGFLVRGIVFIILGACFLTANLVMARRKKQQEVIP
ncbi:MAG: hypothetical protein DRP64_02740 [Verrucomicrobia bacterium]|nr:MAG: hypothetical protein DRP64_02740 [Verrucomicrobiota bacterium]